VAEEYCWARTLATDFGFQLDSHIYPIQVYYTLLMCTQNLSCAVPTGTYLLGKSGSFEVLLTVHLSIILAFNQLNAQNLVL